MHSTKFMVLTVRRTGSMSKVSAGTFGGVSRDEHRPAEVSCALAVRILPTCKL